MLVPAPVVGQRAGELDQIRAVKKGQKEEGVSALPPSLRPDQQWRENDKQPEHQYRRENGHRHARQGRHALGREKIFLGRHG